MFMRSIVAILSLATAGIVLADAFRWVDENGVVQYSDRPHPGAERIVLQAGGTQRLATRTGPVEPDPTPSENTPDTQNYESINIASPGAEETLWNIGGTLTVSVNLRPGLQPGHRVRVYFDGGEPTLVTGTSFEIPEVFRGVHNIQAEVIDQGGQLKIRSQTNRFYVQQNTVITRARPRN